MRSVLFAAIMFVASGLLRAEDVPSAPPAPERQILAVLLFNDCDHIVAIQELSFVGERYTASVLVPTLYNQAMWLAALKATEAYGRAGGTLRLIQLHYECTKV